MSKLAINGGQPIRTEPWFPEYPPFLDRVDQEVAAVERVIRSRLLSAQYGSEVEKFERAFAEYIGVKHAVAVSCGTTALQLALAALGVGVADEVIVPAYTFLATATSVLMQNAIPVFADCESNVQGIDLEHVKKMTTTRTKAIMAVHVNGYPMDMDPLLAFAREKGLAVIEDCAHAHGAEYKGKKVGSIGDINCFSFQQKKNLSLGEGGMITTDDDEWAEKARGLRSFGRNVDLAYNFRMTELYAAIGQVRLPDLDRQNAIRIENADYLHRRLEAIQGITTQKPLPETKCVYYNLIVRYQPQTLGVPLARFIEAVNAEGVVIGRLYIPVYRYRSFQADNCFGKGCPYHCPHYKAPKHERPSYADGTCPVAEDNCDNRNIEIKVHAPATTKDMADVALAIEKVIDNIDELR